MPHRRPVILAAALFRVGYGLPSNTWFLGPTRVRTRPPSGLKIGRIG